MTNRDLQNIKVSLHQRLLERLKEQITATEQSIAAVIASRDNETKSSVGDKYETGRVMMQLEQQKQEGQLSKLVIHRKELELQNVERGHKRVELGALVLTSRGNFYLSIPMGKVMIDEIKYFAISMVSPMGQALYGKAAGAKVAFKGIIEIENIV